MIPRQPFIPFPKLMDTLPPAPGEIPRRPSIPIRKDLIERTQPPSPPKPATFMGAPLPQQQAFMRGPLTEPLPPRNVSPEAPAPQSQVPEQIPPTATPQGAPIPSRYDAMIEKQRHLQDLQSDPKLKNSPENQVVWWKRLLEGAFRGVQSANQMAHDEASLGRIMDGGQAAAIVAGGAGGGLVARKGIADIRHQRELDKLNPQIKEEEERMQHEAQRTKLYADAQKAIDDGEAAQAKANTDKLPKLTLKALEDGNVYWQTEGSKDLEVAINPTTGKPLRSDEVYSEPPNANGEIITRYKHGGEIVRKTEGLPKIDPVEAEDNRRQTDWETAGEKIEREADESDALVARYSQNFAQAKEEYERAKKDPNVSTRAVDELYTELQNIKREEAKAIASASAARKALKRHMDKKPIRTKAIGDDNPKLAGEAAVQELVGQGVPIDVARQRLGVPAP